MEYIITGLIILSVGFIIFKNLKKSAKGQCNCSGCSSNCSKRKKEAK
nr:FeoB-associated Cys-rich membrane protein [Clostridium massiliamazoniense]